MVIELFSDMFRFGDTFFLNIISYFERKKSFQFNFLQTLCLPEQFISRNHEEAFILLPFGSKYSEIMI